MGNCLVTKLKEAVNNDNLYKIDELIYSSDKAIGIGANYWFGIRPVSTAAGESSLSVEITPVKGNVYVGTDTKPQEPISGTVTRTTTEKVTIRNFNVWADANSAFTINNKYNLAFIFQAATLKPQDIQYYDNLRWVCVADGALSSISLSKLSNIERFMLGKNIQTDISLTTIIAAMPSIQRLYLNESRQNITMTQLGQSCNNSIVVIEIYGSCISGTVEDYVTAQRSNYTSGRVYFSITGSHSVTYNGSVLGGTFTVEWDANSITVR